MTTRSISFAIVHWDSLSYVPAARSRNVMHKQRSDHDRATLLDRIAYAIFSAVSVGLVAGLLWDFWMVFFHAPHEYFSTLYL